MPEGPIILILKQEVQQFKGKRTVAAESYIEKLDVSVLEGQKVIDFKTFGKNFLICFDQFTIRIHLMLFGSYRINSRSAKPAKLHLEFENGELNFYACSVTMLTQPLDELYDWSADIMNDDFNHDKAIQKLKANPNLLACDALMDQHIFAGSGNIIKNEVLFRTRIHPLSKVGMVPDDKLNELVTETVNYSFDFLEWKNESTLKKHSLAYFKPICPRDHVPFHKEVLGKTKRGTYFCNICQVLYT